MPDAHFHLETHSDDAAQIMAEHRLLKKVLANLAATHEVSQIVVLLGQLRDLLKGHFEREERADGILGDVREHAPQRVDEMAGILAEHEAFLATIDQLEADAHSCLEGPIAELFDGIRQLEADLHDHEARESEIFLDVIYTDVGTKD